MTKEQVKQYYHRFCRWQQEEPHYVNRHEGRVQHCHNCGHEFEGNFCPVCGQRAEVGRVGWLSCSWSPITSTNVQSINIEHYETSKIVDNGSRPDIKQFGSPDLVYQG